MSRIDDLIRDLCPNGVDHKTLGEVGEFIRGSGIKKSDFIKQGYPCIHYGQIHTHYGISADETISHISPEQATRLRKAQPGDLIIATTSEDDDAVGKATAWLGTTPVAVGGDSFIFRHSMDPKYVSYFFSSTAFSQQKQPHLTGAKVRRIAASSLSKIVIPTPPIEVQQEVAGALDKFTQLEAELEAELEARRQQYFHYCTSAFDFATNVEWTTLERVSLKISSGGTPSSSNSAYYGGNIPWVRSQDVNFNMISSTSATISDIGLKNSAAKWIPSNSLIIAMYGASAARAAINTTPVTTNQACCNLQLDATKVTPRYAYHWIYSQYNKLRSLGEGSQSNLNSRKIKNYPIPVPSLNEQRRITDALDQFHSLVNDLTSGLPAEIEARRKQYEYYRDRLLTFPEKK